MEEKFGHELAIFAKDHTTHLLYRHPMLNVQPHMHDHCHVFIEEMSEWVLLKWREIKNEVALKLSSDYPAFVESHQSFKQYLKVWVDATMQGEHCVINQIIGLSAILLETVCFAYNKRHVDFIHHTENYMFFVLSDIKAEDFYETGGWSHFASVARKQVEGFSSSFVYDLYMSTYISNSSASGSNEISNANSTLETSGSTLTGNVSTFHDSSEKDKNLADEQKTSNDVAEKHSEVVQILDKPVKEPEDDSAYEQESSKEVTEKSLQENVTSLYKPEKELKNDLTDERETINEVTEKNSQEVVSMLCEPGKEPKNYSTEEILKEVTGKNSQEIVLVLCKPEKEPDLANGHETLNEETGKNSQELSVLPKPEKEPVNNSTDEPETSKEVTENSQEVVSTLRKPEKESENDSTEETLNEVAEKNFQTVVSILCKPEKEPDSPEEQETLNGVTEISQDVSKLCKPEKEPKNDLTEEILNEATERNFQAASILCKPEKEPNLTDEHETLNEVSEKNSQEVASILCELSDELESYSANEKETLNEITEKIFREAVTASSEHEIEPSKNSTRISTLCKETAEIENLSIRKYNDALIKEPNITLSSVSTVSESNKLTVEPIQRNEYPVEPKLSLLPEASVHQDESESTLPTKKESLTTDSSFHLSVELKKSQINPEYLVQAESKTSGSSEYPGTNDTSDTTKLKDCLSESTNPMDSELAKEVDEFLIKEITTHFQVRFLKDEEVEAMFGFPEDTTKSAIKISCQNSPQDKISNTADKLILDQVTCGEQKYNLHPVIQSEIIQSNLEIINNQNKQTGENERNTGNRVKDSISTEHSCCINTTKNDSNLFKSPKLETGKKCTPMKAKTPTGKFSVKDSKNKDVVVNRNEKVTPIKTPNAKAKSSCVSSIGGNMAETPKAKISISDFTKSSPCFKASTDRGVQSKSCEKTERSKKLFLPNASVEITKSSPRSFSSPPAIAKSSKREFSPKPLPADVQTKLNEKDPPLNQLKSPNITCASSPKSTADTTDLPIACEKVKRKVQPTNPTTENCQKTPGSSSAKSSENENCTKSSEESSDTKSGKEAFCHARKCDQSNGNKPPIASAKNASTTTTSRARNAPVKHAAADSKNEKPRWR